MLTSPKVPAPSKLAELFAQSAEKTKKRFALILLDLFIGGFAVGIVLMMPLSRPPSDITEVGGGGPQFMMIEFFWEDNGRLIVPILHHTPPDVDGTGSEPTTRIDKFGIGAPFGHGGSKLWPSHDRGTGQVEGLEKRYDEIQMDGFFLNKSSYMKGTLLDGNKPYNYAYIWISRPCSGKWSVSLREPDRKFSKQGNEAFTVRLNTRIDGYSKDDDIEGDAAAPPVIVSNIVLDAKSVNSGLQFNGGALVEKEVADIGYSDDVAFTYCPPV
jgi:hypothetical protein